MKNFIFIVTFSACFVLISVVHAGDRDIIQGVLDSHIRKDSYRWLLGTYKNNLNINNIQNFKSGRKRVTGTFNTLTELGTTLTRHFTSELKLINGEYFIISCCWRTAFGTEWCTKVQ